VALRKGKPLPAGVDGRADVFALGAVLYQALGGAVPYLPGVSPALRELNPQVGAGLSDVVAKCLEPGPADRYADAAALAADLRRHLADRRLAGVRNRPVERWAKWRRRKPHGLPLLLLFALLAAAAVGGGLAGWYAIQKQYVQPRDRARHELEDGRQLLGQGRL